MAFHAAVIEGSLRETPLDFFKPPDVSPVMKVDIVGEGLEGRGLDTGLAGKIGYTDQFGDP